ncbi:peptidoglycan-binding domain-containing protein, partial [Enterovirga sp.]|uniref:peptidoglycan-binding domain-containing protein n=1 Tax=Enterovirga sp. TaxID=2026350 RepID=UPI002631DF16
MVRSFKAGAAALLAAALLLAASPAPGQPAGAASEAVPAPAGEAARAAFESLPEDDRSAVQDALVWTGDYSGAADGTFGRRTFEAIVAYQRRARRPPDGILDPAERAALLAAGAAARNAAGFQILSDPATGIRLGIPLRLLPRRSPTGRDGTRFQSTDGRVTLDLRAQEGDEADLRALYDRNLASPAPGRSVTYRLHRPTLFVVAGETPGGKFFTRYAAGPDGLRGVSIGYDKALAGEVDRIVVAVSNSFTPFPGPEGVMAGPTPPPRPAPAPP